MASLWGGGAEEGEGGGQRQPNETLHLFRESWMNLNRTLDTVMETDREVITIGHNN